MSSPRRFEGPVLEDVLERVRRDAGGEARIVAANRVRRGGLGGFFAKEHFEVLVDIATNGDNAHAPRSVLDLVEATNDEERTAQLVDLTDAGAPAISTEGAAFHDVLARLSTDVTRPATDPPPAIERAVPAGAEHRYRPDADLRPDAVIEAVVPTRPESRDRPELVIAAQPAPVVSTIAPVPTRSRGRVRERPQVLERPENALARLGLPPRHIPRGATSSRLRAALIESLADLPAVDPLPDAPGVTVAVVGVGARSLRLARTLADEQGLDADNVVIAAPGPLGDAVPSWLQITDAPTADERRRSWRRRADATFVAVAMTPDGDGADWAASMLDALEPTQIWAITHAAWKPDDIDAWCEQLGGVDVLALERLDDTVSPAAVLGLGLPIGRLEGAPATAMRWAELLLERLTLP